VFVRVLTPYSYSKSVFGILDYIAQVLLNLNNARIAFMRSVAG